MLNDRNADSTLGTPAAVATVGKDANAAVRAARTARRFSEPSTTPNHNHHPGTSPPPAQTVAVHSNVVGSLSGPRRAASLAGTLLGINSRIVMLVSRSDKRRIVRTARSAPGRGLAEMAEMCDTSAFEVSRTLRDARWRGRCDELAERVAGDGTESRRHSLLGTPPPPLARMLNKVSDGGARGGLRGTAAWHVRTVSDRGAPRVCDAF